MKHFSRVVATLMLVLTILGISVSPAPAGAAPSAGRIGSNAAVVHDEQAPSVSAHHKSATDTPTAVPTETETDTPMDTPTDTATETPTDVPTDTPVSTEVATNTPTSTPAATAATTGTPATPKANSVSAAATVPPAEMTLSTSPGVAGSAVTVSLANFPRSKSANVTIAGIAVGSIYVGSSRSGSKSFTVPRTTGGHHTIQAVSGGVSASHAFQIDAHETVSTTAVIRGNTMTVWVDGFGANETLALRLYLPNGSSNYSTLLHFSVNASGYGQVTFTIPTSATAGVRKLSSYSASTHAGVYIAVSAGSSTKLLVNKENAQGAHLVQSCFSVYADAGGGALGTYITGACDPQDGNLDGVVTFSGLAGGDYVLKEFHSPNGYLNGTIKTFHQASSGTTSVTVR